MKGKEIHFTENDLKTIGQRVSASINRMTESKFSTDFISKPRNDGFKVNPYFQNNVQ